MTLKTVSFKKHYEANIGLSVQILMYPKLSNIIYNYHSTDIYCDACINRWKYCKYTESGLFIVLLLYSTQY